MTADPGYPTVKDRKQEAIGLLGEWRDNILRPNALSPEECYDRIAPLMQGIPEFPATARSDGETTDCVPKQEIIYTKQEDTGEGWIDRRFVRPEFPDEALKDLLLDADLWSKEGLFWKVKCLVQGHPAETGEKGTCQTCGGSSGHICHDGEFRRWPGLACSNCAHQGVDLCPDCDGTGEERRSGKERRKEGSG